MSASELTQAVTNNDLGEVQRLLSAGGDVNSATLIAAFNGHTQVLRLLLDHGGDIDFRRENGVTALMLSARRGHTDCVRLLLQRGAKATLLDGWDFSARTWALTEGHQDIAALLSAAEAKEEARIAKFPHTSEVSARELIHAVDRNDLERVGRLLDSGVDVNSRDLMKFSVLMIAAKNGHLDVVRELVLRGANVNATEGGGETATIMAASYGHTQVLRLLLDHGGEIDVREGNGATALMLAARNGHMDCVKLLLQRGAETTLRDGWNYTARDWARGHPDIAALLAKAEANISQVPLTFNDSASELIHAVSRNDVDTVGRLLDAGEDVNSQDINGFTNLMIAARSGHLGVATELVERGAYVNATAVHLAASSGHTQVLRLLLEHGGEIDAREGNGATPLMLSARNGHLDCVRLLLDRGADYTLRDRRGMSAGDLAIKEGHQHIDAFLATAEAETSF